MKIKLLYAKDIYELEELINKELNNLIQKNYNILDIDFKYVQGHWPEYIGIIKFNTLY